MHIVLLVLATAFWLWMLYDCWRHDPDWFGWLFVIVPLWWVGALIYFVLRKAPNLRLRMPSWWRRMSRQQELLAAVSAARNIGNAYQFTTLGDIQRDLEDWDAALQSYAEARRKDPKSVYAWWGTAQTHLATENFAAARDALKEVLALDAGFKYGEAYLAYGDTLFELGELAAAREHLEKDLRRWNYPEARLLLGMIYAEEGDRPKARSQVEELLVDLQSHPAGKSVRHRRVIMEGKRLLRQLA